MACHNRHNSIDNIQKKSRYKIFGFRLGSAYLPIAIYPFILGAFDIRRGTGCLHEWNAKLSRPMGGYYTNGTVIYCGKYALFFSSKVMDYQ